MADTLDGDLDQHWTREVERLPRSAITSVKAIIRTFREFLLAGFLWTALSAVMLQGSTMVSTIIVARFLGVESFGAYSILVATVMTIANIASGAAGLVATKYVAEFMASSPARVARVLRMCRIVTLVTGASAATLMFAGAHVLGSRALGRPDLEPLIRLVAVAALFQVSSFYQYGALQGFGAFRALGRVSVLAGFGQVALMAVGAWVGALTGALLGFVGASALRVVIFEFVLHHVRRARAIPDTASLDRGDFRLIWRFWLPAGLVGFVITPSLWLVTVFVARLPDGLRLVAMLAVAHQCRLAVLQLPSLLNTVSFSVLSRIKGLKQADGFRRVFWSNLVVTLAFSSLVVIALVMAAEPLLRLYGRDFVSGRSLLIVLLLSVLPETLGTSWYQLIQTGGRMWQSLFAIAIPRDVLYVALAAMLLPTYGVIGAGLAYGVAQCVSLLATIVMARGIAGGRHLEAEQ